MKAWKTGIAALSLVCLANPVPALAACEGPRDVAALKSAALQQRLMVAALTCHAIDAYNRFVVAYRPELQRSDADLKSFFIRNGGRGEADYDTYKTKLANQSAFREATGQASFCAGTAREFATAFQGGRSLDDIAANEPTPARDVCTQTMLATALAAATKTAPRMTRVASADVAVAGVPAIVMPATPYGDATPQRPTYRAYGSDRPSQRAMPAARQADDADDDSDDSDDYDGNDNGIYVMPPPRPPYAYTILADRPAPPRYRRWYARPAPDYYAHE